LKHRSVTVLQRLQVVAGYLDHLDDDTSPGAEAETADSGG